MNESGLGYFFGMNRETRWYSNTATTLRSLLVTAVGKLQRGREGHWAGGLESHATRY